jgi:hypothetical protein
VVIETSAKHPGGPLESGRLISVKHPGGPLESVALIQVKPLSHEVPWEWN